MNYFISRNPRTAERLVTSIQSDLSYIDCLSSPVTIAYLISKHFLDLKGNRQKYDHLNIICIGCQDKSEGRIVRESNSWGELRLLLGDRIGKINLWIVGTWPFFSILSM